MRVGIYPRVSTREQAKEGYSIPEQIERLTNYCKAHGWTIVDTYTDPGYSGGDMNRPGLQRMIKDVEAGLLDKVVVYKLDRLSRSQKDTLFIIEDILLKNNTDFVSMTENLDTGSPFGKAMIGILAVFAQLEREQIRERLLMGREARAKEGYYTASSRILTGYDYVDGELIVNDYEAMIVNEMFRMFNNGMQLKTIANLLNDRGLTRRGVEWHDTTIRRILDNRHLIGEVSFSQEWYPGRHTAIVDKEVFDKTQKLLAERDKHKHSNRHATSLTGFMLCGCCGAKYHRQDWKKKNDGTRTANYMCYSKSKKVKNMIVDPNCNNKVYKVPELEAIVFGEIKKLATDPEYLETLREKSEVSDSNQRRRIIDEEIAGLSSQIGNLMKLYSLNRLTLQEVDDQIAPLTDQRAKLEEELKKLGDIKAEEKLSNEDIREIAAGFSDTLIYGTIEDIRATIGSLIEVVVIKGEDVEIHWNFV